MHKVMSTLQLAANRRNARKSTGPRTREGKARAARNNTRHGFFSSDLVLTAGPAIEDFAEFDAMRSALHDDLQPATALELACVEQLVCCLWLARRALGYETTLLPGETPHPDGLHYFNRPSFLACLRFENRLDRAFHLALQHFRALRRHPLRHHFPGPDNTPQSHSASAAKKEIATRTHLQMKLQFRGKGHGNGLDVQGILML